jgi:hypothetical protein
MVAVSRLMFSLSDLFSEPAPLSIDFARFGIPGEVGGLGGEIRGAGGITLTVCALGRLSDEEEYGVRVEKTEGAVEVGGVGGLLFGGGGRGMDGGRLGRSETGVFSLGERGGDGFLVAGEGGRMSMTGARTEPADSSAGTSDPRTLSDRLMLP